MNNGQGSDNIMEKAKMNGKATESNRFTGIGFDVIRALVDRIDSDRDLIKIYGKNPSKRLGLYAQDGDLNFMEYVPKGEKELKLSEEDASKAIDVLNRILVETLVSEI
ncbi:MAG: hypothetical protein V1921_05585 [Candidatus Altiarchaeota archaeon]